MTAGTILALVLAALVGASLGALGGGGSILTLPILVYVAGIEVRQAVAISMVVVGGASLSAAVAHARQGNLHIKAALLFAATGMVGAFFGSALTSLVSQRGLMLTFAALMLAAGGAMLRERAEDEERPQCRVYPCLGVGAGVGVLTGFLGVGGGFLIVPALVLFAGIETRLAIGTSLAIIALNSAAGLLGQLRRTSFDWTLAFAFLALALAGMRTGLRLAERVSSRSLRKAFAWFVIALALVIAVTSLLGIRLK
jgi:hypothetical protein